MLHFNTRHGVERYLGETIKHVRYVGLRAGHYKSTIRRMNLQTFLGTSISNALRLHSTVTYYGISKVVSSSVSIVIGIPSMEIDPKPRRYLIMATYQCSKCGQEDDTGWTDYWFDVLRGRPPVCARCDPTQRCHFHRAQER